jgi:hypothetical protein
MYSSSSSKESPSYPHSFQVFFLVLSVPSVSDPPFGKEGHNTIDGLGVALGRMMNTKQGKRSVSE